MVVGSRGELYIFEACCRFDFSQKLPLFLAIGVLAGNLSAKQIYVAVNGDDANRGNNEPIPHHPTCSHLAQTGRRYYRGGGVYRERVSPPARRPIGWQAHCFSKRLRVETAEITGSEIISNWVKSRKGVGRPSCPNSFFENFNPFNDVIHGDWYREKGHPIHTGAVYLNGALAGRSRSLDEVLASGGEYAVMGNAGRYQCWLTFAWLRPVNTENAGRIPGHGFCRPNAALQNARAAEGGDAFGWITRGDWLRYEKV